MEQEYIQTAFRTAFTNNYSSIPSLLSLPKSTDKAISSHFPQLLCQGCTLCDLLQSILINNGVLTPWLNVISI